METTGAGLRAWGIAQALKSRGFDVIAAMPFQSVPAGNEELKNNLARFCFDRKKIGEYIDTHNPDLIVLQHWGMFRDLPELKCPIVIDLAGPHLLERKYWGSTDFEGDLLEKLSALRSADFLICSGEIQRLYFLPYLMLAGWDTDENCLPVIPFSIDAKRTGGVQKQVNPDLFIYSGRFLPWQNPEKPIRWLLEVFEARGQGELAVYGGAHPFGDVSQGKFLPFLKEIEKNPRVSFRGTRPFFQLLSEMSIAGAALDLLPKNPERELAFTSRTMAYFWAEIPVIYNNYSEISKYIDKHDAGWTLDPENEQCFKSLINQILDNPEMLNDKRRNIGKLKGELSWDKTIEPLIPFCINPHFRKNKTLKILSHEAKESRLKSLESELNYVKNELFTLKGKTYIKLLQKIQSFPLLTSVIAFLFLLPIALILLALFTIVDIGASLKR